MTVLVIYETTEGQTEKIARFVADQSRRLGNDTVLIEAGGLESISFDGVGAVILAAPVHQRRHPRKFEALLEAHKDALATVKTLMLSVSLSAAFPEGHAEAEEYLVEMKMRTGLNPDAEALVAGAVRTEKYDYFALQVVRHVILRDRDIDTPTGDHESTDWRALERTVEAFLKDAQ